MTEPEIKALTDLIVESVGAGVEPIVPVLKALRADIADLQSRLKQAEARQTGVSYEGVFQPGKTYQRASLVTRSGGLWLALRDTSAAPPSDSWKLVVKEGRAQ